MQEIVYHTNFEIEDTYWWFVARNQIIYDFIQNQTDIKPHAFILDVGCGTGGFAAKLKNTYIPVCLDASATALEYCKKRGINLLHNMYLQDFPKNKYNLSAIIMLDVIEHIKDADSVLHSACELLPPGGTLIITVPAYMWLWSKHDEIHQHYRRYTKKQLNQAIKNAGFEIEYSTYFNFFLFFPAILKRFLDKLTGADKKNQEPVEKISPFLNKIFTRIFKFEGNFLGRIKFPFGVSILASAKKI